MEGTLAFPPWLDLLEPLVELVLERLPLIDYIRFAAVCPKWRSIQKCHRLRHAPHPPPMANQLPWLATRWLNRYQGLKCYTPSDRKSYCLPIPNSLHKSRCLASCRGWPNDHCAVDWTIIQLTALQGAFVGSAIYCSSKFYYSRDCSDELYVIDPFLQDAASQLLMRYPYEASMDTSLILQEIDGELFSVQTLYGSNDIKGFRVFKADLSKKKWLRVETLGDYTLFHYDACSVFLLAADVGCKRNSIYACKDRRMPGHAVFAWGAFDLGTCGWTEEDTLIDRYFGPWFLPTLDSANPTKASD